MSTTTTLSDPIVTLESDLTVFATPQKTGSAGTPGDWKSSSAGTPGTLLTTAGIALGILRNVGPVANALDTLGTTLSSALGVAADVLNAIGDTIAGVAAGANTPTDITDAIATLQDDRDVASRRSRRRSDLRRGRPIHYVAHDVSAEFAHRRHDGSRRGRERRLSDVATVPRRRGRARG